MCCLAYEYDLYQNARAGGKNKKKCDDCAQQAGGGSKTDDNDPKENAKTQGA
jgi:hypothetical protein